MSVQLDHTIVPARGRRAAAELLAFLYRSTPHGPVDMQVNTAHGGRIVYWSEPDGHVWEALTVSYARQPQQGTSRDA